MNTLQCIKCQAQYQSEDPEPYYCQSCEEEKKAIAKEIDKKMAGRVSKRAKSDLQMFDEIAKARGTHFVNIKDMGITL